MKVEKLQFNGGTGSEKKKESKSENTDYLNVIIRRKPFAVTKGNMT